MCKMCVKWSNLLEIQRKLFPKFVTPPYGPHTENSFSYFEASPRQATVPVVTKAACREAYKDIDVNIGDNKVCAGKGTTDTCNGDSGGPLLADNRGNRSVVVTLFNIVIMTAYQLSLYVSVYLNVFQG